MNTTKHILILLALIALAPTAWAQGLSGTGSSTEPYLIQSAADWNTFAQSVTNGTTYADEFVKLTADISVSTMTGNDSHPFSGTLDGDGHTIALTLSGSGQGTALFYLIENATLKNLKVEGSVTTTGYRPTTFAAIVEGNSTISNCLSTVDVSSTMANDWVDGGGFVGRVSSNATLNMTGCAFHGSVTFTESATTGGGMVGYTQTDATVYLTNCLYSPSALTLNVNAYNPRIFVCGNVAGNLNNCYYNDVAANSVLENEGNQAFSIIGIKSAIVAFDGNATTYGVSGIVAYSVGMKYAGTCYAGETETVSLWLTHNHPGYTYGNGYIASAGTLDLNGIGIYTLIMPDQNVTIEPIITAYTVSVACTPNIAGAAQVSLDNTNWSSSVSAAEGQVVYCKTNNVIGYTRSGYTIETENGGLVSLTDGHFTMPAANVTYYVDFSPSSAYIGDYTVTLSPGMGEGEPIVYTFSPETAKPNAATAENLKFYYVNYNTLGFRLSENYCPSSFTVPNGVYFIGWDRWSNNGYITLNSTETTFTAQWGNPIPPLSPGSYIDGNGEYHTCNNYTVLTGGQGETTLAAGWYVVDSDITYSNRYGHAITLDGDVTLILCNCKTMTVTATRNGINGNGHSLTIYGQSLDPNVAGTLNVHSNDYDATNVSTYTQHSGKVIVSSLEAGKAIYTRGFTLNGGSLEASGKNCGIATSDGSDLTINGGTVTANSTRTEDGYAGLSGGGNVVINGGKVWANKIFAGYNITLGYTYLDDFILAGEYLYNYYDNGSTVSVKSGQTFYYENNGANVTVSGTIANPNSTIAGKTLRPYIVPITITKEIAGYSTGDGGWHLIASPLQGNNYVEYVSGLISATASHYDLYRFNQEANKEWENYKANSPTNHPDFITLRNGRGYLYAHSTDTTLVFSGVPYSGNGVVDLIYSTANSDANMHGWNLVGNPFGTAATLGTTPFYRMNATGTEIIVSETNTVDAMEGIFVKATTTGQSVTFTQATAPLKSPQRGDIGGFIVLDLGHGNAVIDRAIVRLGEGQTLPKFQMRDNSTKIYIPQVNEDYAVVSVGGTDGACTVSTEIPVNFKAEENGTYTLTANIDNMEMSYLHLVDNMTGADVDLLTPPACGHPLTEGDVPLYKGGQGDSTTHTATYTFTAKTTDYESRFKLVFSVGGDANGDNEAPFAFINNGNIIVNGEGTLQVIDLMGRVIRTVGLSQCGSRTSTAGMPAGVYVLRLIDGNDVKVQKIVIR